MADYIIGGILVALAILALRSVFKHLPAVVPAAAAVMAADPAVTDRIGNCLQISGGMADACGVEALQIIDKSF